MPEDDPPRAVLPPENRCYAKRERGQVFRPSHLGAVPFDLDDVSEGLRRIFGDALETGGLAAGAGKRRSGPLRMRSRSASAKATCSIRAANSIPRLRLVQTAMGRLPGDAADFAAPVELSNDDPVGFLGPRVGELH